jgi:TolB-like protein
VIACARITSTGEPGRAIIGSVKLHTGEEPNALSARRTISTPPSRRATAVARTRNVGAAGGVHIRLFLSAVTDEFRSYRDALRGKLTRPNVTVQVQEDFIAAGEDTLAKLDHYIANCDAVIHLAGDMTGAWADDAARRQLKARYADLGDRLPPLAAALETGEPQISYTQWEAYLALYHHKRLFIAVPGPGAPRDPASRHERDLKAAQAAHLARLRVLGRYPEITFANVDELASGILGSAVLDLLAKARGPFWTRRRAITAVAGSAVAAGAGAWLGWPYLFPPPPNAAGVAVLPFENDTNDASLAYLSASAPVELTQALTDLTQFSVVPFASVRSLADPKKDLGRLARDLAVAHVVGGFLTRDAQGPALNADIFDARRNASVRVRVDAQQPTQLITLIVVRVAQALQLELETAQAAGEVGTADDSAYQSYLQAISLSLDLVDENNLQAISLLESATARAPSFTRAHAALAQAYLARFYWLGGGPTWIAKGLTAAREALHLAPSSAEAQTALAFACECGGQRKAAILAYCAACKANPRYAPALSSVARYLFYMAEFDRSIQMWANVAGVDTVANDARIRTAMCHFFKGEYDLAGAWNAKAEARAHGDDELTLVAFTYAWLRDFNSAERVKGALAARDATAHQVTEIDAWIAALRGDRAAAAPKLRALEALAEQNFGLQDELATLYAILGDKEQAIAWLGKAIGNGAPAYAWYVSDFFKLVKDDPRYQAIIKPLADEYAAAKAAMPALS